MRLFCFRTKVSVFGRSELQMRDVKNLTLTGCDHIYIERWAHELGVHILWAKLSHD